MPLLLTQDDLAPLTRDPKAWHLAFDAVEAAYREHQDGATKHVETFAMPLTGLQRSLRVCPGYASGGASLRTYPTIGRGVPDSAPNLLFDPADGRLLALLAGDEL